MRIAALSIRPFRTATATLVLAALSLLAAPAVASAHAFLVQSTPAAGQRLRVTPRSLTLAFTEPVVQGSVHLQVKAAAGSPIKTGRIVLASGGSTVAVSLPPLPTGVYLVDWQVVSAQDGHFSSGEFAFAVGSAASLRGLGSTGGQPTDWPNAAASWLLLLGLALALGSLANELLLGPHVGMDPQRFASRSVLGASLALALTGSAVSLLLFVASLGQGNSFSTWLQVHAWAEALSVPAGMWAAAAFVLVLYALLAASRRLSRASALVALLLAALAVAMRSHPAAGGAWWASLAIAAHVMVALLWVGMLTSLVLVLWRRERLLPRAEVFAAIALYARFALFSALAVLASGIVAALSVFTTASQLIATAYGRVLLGKAALVMVVLLLALFSRNHVSRPKDGDSATPVRRAMRWEAALLALVLGAASLLGNVAPPPPALATSPHTLDPLLGPPPPSGPALTLAGQAGWLEVFLTASQGRLTLQVVSPESEQPSGVRLLSPDSPTGNTIFAEPPSGQRGSIGLALRPCGAGCFTVPFRWRAGVTSLRLQVAAKGWAGGGLTFTLPWPPKPANPSDWAQVLSTLSRQARFTMHEVVKSGPHASASSTYYITGSALIKSEPYPRTAAKVYLLRQAQGASEFVVFFPGSLIWMHVWVDSEHRIIRQVAVDQGHLIVDRIVYPAGGRQP
jgi:copper transport protein